MLVPAFAHLSYFLHGSHANVGCFCEYCQETIIGNNILKSFFNLFLIRKDSQLKVYCKHYRRGVAANFVKRQ